MIARARALSQPKPGNTNPAAATVTLTNQVFIDNIQHQVNKHSTRDNNQFRSMAFLCQPNLARGRDRCFCGATIYRGAICKSPKQRPALPRRQETKRGLKKLLSYDIL